MFFGLEAELQNKQPQAKKKKTKKTSVNPFVLLPAVDVIVALIASVESEMAAEREIIHLYLPKWTARSTP